MLAQRHFCAYHPPHSFQMINFSSCFSARTAVLAACCLALSGCETLSGNPASATTSASPSAPETVISNSERFSDGTYGFMLTEVPRIPGAKPLGSISTLAAFQGDGVFYFNESDESSFRVAGKNASGRYAVK